VSNTITAILPRLLAQGLLALRQNAIMARIVNRSYDAMAGQRGSTIDVPIPSAITPVQVAPDRYAPATADIAPTYASVVMDQWYEAPFYLTDQDLLSVMNGTIPMQASEAIKALANKVDTYILGLYKGVYGFAGSSGVTPLQMGTGEYLNARKTLNKQLAPMDSRFCVMDPDMEANALALRAFQDVSFNGDPQTIVKGTIGEKLGALWLSDQNVPTHTTGAATAGTIALDNGANFTAGQTAIHVDGFSTKPNVGDVFTVAGDSQTYVVTSATDLAGGDSDLTIKPGLSMAHNDNDVLTFKASHVVNLLLHRDAIAFANRPLDNADLGLGNFQSAVDPISGLTLRLEITREFKRTRYSYDILYGGCLVRPELATRIAG
jgi:hypothetical protein